MDERAEAFEARLEQCDPQLQAVTQFLMTAAQHAGPIVDAPTFEVRGIGVNFWTSSRKFCRFDPKPEANHLWVMLPGGDRVVMKRLGSVSDRADGPWMTLHSLNQAVRLVPLIVQAYDLAAGEV